LIALLEIQSENIQSTGLHQDDENEVSKYSCRGPRKTIIRVAPEKPQLKYAQGGRVQLTDSQRSEKGITETNPIKSIPTKRRRRRETKDLAAIVGKDTPKDCRKMQTKGRAATSGNTTTKGSISASEIVRIPKIAPAKFESVNSRRRTAIKKHAVTSFVIHIMQ
jgi:hypothetical protein